MRPKVIAAGSAAGKRSAGLCLPGSLHLNPEVPNLLIANTEGKMANLGSTGGVQGPKRRRVVLVDCQPPNIAANRRSRAVTGLVHTAGLDRPSSTSGSTTLQKRCQGDLRPTDAIRPTATAAGGRGKRETTPLPTLYYEGVSTVDTPKSAREVFIYLGSSGDPRVTADQQSQCAKIGAG